ncbi:hypothetical protein ElP_75300 (plasmid) [Tautonia plasticadhaerens]|uniref:Uncharacterized protein n=1 Tax=Tautonia plasticadhaerens TaxID=2527974 RepID=A0A518HFD5_9BACT|nr:hypothetical protein ElP_75300 [Tautonia plasticadhaerens]
MGLAEELVDRGVTRLVAEGLVRASPEGRIRARIDAMDRVRAARPEEPKGPAAYLVQAIREDFALPPAPDAAAGPRPASEGRVLSCPLSGLSRTLGDGGPPPAQTVPEIPANRRTFQTHGGPEHRECGRAAIWHGSSGAIWHHPASPFSEPPPRVKDSTAGHLEAGHRRPHKTYLPPCMAINLEKDHSILPEAVLRRDSARMTEHGRESGCLRPAVTGAHERRDTHPLGHRAGRPQGRR